MIVAVLPLKPFALAKSRLGPVLDAPRRAALARAMAADVLAALRGVPAIGGILIVSDEPDIAMLAAGAGATCLRDGEVTAGSGPNGTGLNAVAAGAAAHLAAAHLASAHLAYAGAAAMLLVPGDLPRLRPADLAAFIAAWRALPGPARVALAPARHGGGTNLLLAGPPEAIPFSYGPDSFAAHLAAARRLGHAAAVVALAGAAADVDEPADFFDLPKQRSPKQRWPEQRWPEQRWPEPRPPGRHTRAALRAFAAEDARRRQPERRPAPCVPA